jgi:hypothetical protein
MLRVETFSAFLLNNHNTSLVLLGTWPVPYLQIGQGAYFGF